MTQLKMLSTDDKIAEIRRLYFSTTRETVQRDLEKALDLLKSLASEEERERATVYMEGLNEMRRDWTPRPKGPKPGAKPAGPAAAKRANPPRRPRR